MTSEQHPTNPAQIQTNDKNNSREIFGWKMYDWANSAFYTTVVGALFSPYITRLAQDAVGTGKNTELSFPRGLAARDGSLVVADCGNDRLVRFEL